MQLNNYSYKVKSKISELKCGHTWLADLHYNDLKKNVFLQTIYPHKNETPSFEELLEKEGEQAITFKHPNVASVLDFGSYAANKYFIANEHLDSFTLEQMNRQLKRSGLHAPPWFPLYLVINLCHVLTYAYARYKTDGHSPGMLQHCISASNISISLAGMVKCYNLGFPTISTFAYGGMPHYLTHNSAYSAPERLRNNHLCDQSDVYALGVILYELLTGKLPYVAPDTKSLLQIIEEKRILPPGKLTPGIPPELDTIVMRSIDRTIENRQASLENLEQELITLMTKNNLNPSKEEAGLFTCSIFQNHEAMPEEAQEYVKKRHEEIRELPQTERMQWIWLEQILNHNQAQEEMTSRDTTIIRRYLATPEPESQKEDSLSEDDTQEIDLRELLQYAAELDQHYDESIDEDSDVDLEHSSSELDLESEDTLSQTGPLEHSISESGSLAQEKQETVTETQPEQSPPVPKEDTSALPMSEMWESTYQHREAWLDTAAQKNIASYFSAQQSEYPEEDTYIIETDHIPFAKVEKSEPVPKKDDSTEKLSHQKPKTPSGPKGLEYFDLGISALYAKKYSEALIHLQKACEADPKNKTYRTNLKRLESLINDQGSAQS